MPVAERPTAASSKRASRYLAALQHQSRARDALLKLRYSFSLLDLLTKDALDHLRVGSVPAAEEIDGKRHGNGYKLLVRLIESFIGDRPKIVFNKCLLCLIAPQIL